jgi:hypothetical protein
MIRRRISNQPCKFKIGDRIRATAMFDRHDYRRDETYEVVEIDHNDSTLRARDETGAVGRWIRWQDCDVSDEIGWDWLKGQLPAETLELMSAFDGLGTLKLRADLRVAIIQHLPALKVRVIEACAELEANAASHAANSQPQTPP